MSPQKPTGPKYVRIIADYGGPGDLAFGEVVDRLHEQMRDAGVAHYHIDLTSVPVFDTYATGFELAQLAINSHLGENHIFYVNTAPRQDRTSARINNEGEGLVYAKLKNGAHVVAVNSGYSLTLIKPFAEKIVAINVPNAGSQFRSRDIFPQAVGAILRGDESIFGKDVSHTVPDAFPENRVVYTDGYGNIKCSVDPAKIEEHKGKWLHVHIGDSDQVPVMAGVGMFDVSDGMYCFSNGSSGWMLDGGLKVTFAQISKRGGSAAASFKNPIGGTKIEWRPAPR